MENSPEKITGKPLKELVLEKLAEKGHGSCWLWLMFVLCLTPNILNGFHLSSYVFLSNVPANFFCIIPQLKNEDWTNEQIRNIAVNGGTTVNQSCQVYARDYDALSKLSYAKALANVQNNSHQPPEVSCLDIKGKFHYEQNEGTSIVPEWDLVCERTALRSNVQVALSVGKFIGGLLFGVISDKYGRKTSFVIAALIYICSGILSGTTHSYILFVLSRVGLGMGVFYSLFTLVTENSDENHRSWLSIAYNFSYPIGMIYSAISAYYAQTWRWLQLVLTVPSFLLITHFTFLVESPRWLLSKGHEKKAYKAVFGKNPSVEYDLGPEKLQISKEEKFKLRFSERIKEYFKEFTSLYSTPEIRRRSFIAHFSWCMTSMSYYVLGLNSSNFAANPYIYVSVTGTVDILSYVASMVILKYMGRKKITCVLYLFTGVCLLILQFIPKEYKISLIILAMAGRFGITSVYAIITLHTAELFPTEIRNTAIGVNSTMAAIGSIISSYVVDILGLVVWYLPTTICGFSAVLAGLLTLFLPETKGKLLNDLVEQETVQKKDYDQSNK